MKVALIQSNLSWENPDENRENLTSKINQINENIDLIVLPEMFTTGFTMNPKPFAETMDGTTILWLKFLAKTKNCAITGSLIISENNNFYNRLVFIHPEGKIDFYDKKHLFTLAGENKIYTSGNQKIIIDYKGFKICPLICYDLRFPVFARNDVDYDLLIFVANWPITRINAWDILLKARAVENMCYTIAVNRIGLDNNNLEHSGHSQAIDFFGNYLIEPQKTAGVFITNLDKNKMLDARKKLDFLSDKDDFILI
jgi:predicted amidohydrolase